MQMSRGDVHHLIEQARAALDAGHLPKAIRLLASVPPETQDDEAAAQSMQLLMEAQSRIEVCVCVCECEWVC